MEDEDIQRISRRLEGEWRHFCDQQSGYGHTHRDLSSLLETMKLALIELLKSKQEGKNMKTQKVWEEIKKQFPGVSNRALRDRIFKLAQNSGRVIGIERTVALTIQGKTGLRKVQKILDE